MTLLRRLFHILGGLPFAILLIASTALMVIAGTILESKTDSHRFAASITYGNPLFTLLLCGFFVNILFSSLRRWPFQRKHIPFLVTHLGLLMVLAGAIIKLHYGTQGHMLILEGSGSDRITLPNSETLIVEKRSPALPPPQIETLDKQEHGLEIRKSWIADGKLHLVGLSPFPVIPYDKTAKSIPIGHRVRFDEEHEFDLIALNSSEWESAARQIYEQVMNNPTANPTLAWIEDPSSSLHFFAFDKWNGVFGTTLSMDDLEAIVVYDKGFGGYTVPLEVPIGHTAECPAPPIQLFVEACQRHNLDPQQELDSFFAAWHSQPNWLLPPNFPMKSTAEQAIRSINWKLIPPDDYKCCLWASILFDKIEEGLAEGFTLQELIQMGNWPLKAESNRDLLFQLFSIAPQLPDLNDKVVDPARLLSIYIRLYGLFPFKMMTLESPLIIEHEAADPLVKWEENSPLIQLKVNQESISLLFDKSGQGLKQPTKNGLYLLRYAPDSVQIPYRLRIRQARQINYPGTTQPYSFEADIVIKGASLQEEEPVTLSMNHVYETPEGYRFYLAGISPTEAGAVKRVQIVVNHDPVKYFLTYPGAIILVLGILLLFVPSLRNLFRAY